MAGPTPWILDNRFYDPLWLVFGRFRDEILVVYPDTSDIPVSLMTSCDKAFTNNLTSASAIITAFSRL